MIFSDKDVGPTFWMVSDLDPDPNLVSDPIRFFSSILPFVSPSWVSVF